MLPLRTDLFTTPPPSEPAPCGFIPTLGWSGRLQRNFHLIACAERNAIKAEGLGGKEAPERTGEP